MSDVPTQVIGDESDVVVPEITVEERKLSLHDFLKAVIRFQGSDLHLQADSAADGPRQRQAEVPGCPSPSNETMHEYVRS